MDVLRITPQLTLIPLDQQLRGFTSFIGAWLYQGEATVLVDVGPSSTVDRLCQALASLGKPRLDAILLTHIHIDHAGGTGDFVQRFSPAPVVCHPRALEHMARPDALWQGSLKTLGDTARAYGPIQPVPRELLTSSEDFSGFGVRPIPTPGHAVHHVSYLAGSVLFAGEAGGVRMEIPGKGDWLRPATPPRFIPEISLQSLRTLMETPHDVYCYGHFGAVLHNNRELMERHARQLKVWGQVIEEQMRDGEQNLEARCMNRLLEKDPELALHPELPGDVLHREKGFMINSIKGFTGHLRDSQAAL